MSTGLLQQVASQRTVGSSGKHVQTRRRAVLLAANLKTLALLGECASVAQEQLSIAGCVQTKIGLLDLVARINVFTVSRVYHKRAD